MAFSDPQSITISGTAISLPRIPSGNKKGIFATSDLKTRIEVDPKVGNRVSVSARLYQNKVVTDPLVTTTNVVVGDMVSLTINKPIAGYTDDDILAQVTGFIAWLTAGTNANLKKLIAGEA